jgi:murein DD-endopeptidase MepM/ murein hydrolase activator NlpD
VSSDAARRDGRRLLLAVREETPRSLRSGPFRPPASVSPVGSFGGHEERDGLPVERTSDGTWGERQRALEFPLPPGSAVGAPAGGRVVLAERLTLTGGTLVIDHGEGLVSALYPLEKLALGVDDEVRAGQRVGVSGLDPLGDAPRVEWGLYLHGIAVDPRVVMEVDPLR